MVRRGRLLCRYPVAGIALGDPPAHVRGMDANATRWRSLSLLPLSGGRVVLEERTQQVCQFHRHEQLGRRSSTYRAHHIEVLQRHGLAVDLARSLEYLLERPGRALGAQDSRLAIALGN